MIYLWTFLVSLGTTLATLIVVLLAVREAVTKQLGAMLGLPSAKATGPVGGITKTNTFS